MRILSGRYKGINIKTESKGGYRPTSSRVRKSIFDILGSLSDFTVLDLFAGTGILGFEAASRGAAHITFVENNRLAVNGIKLNMARFQGFSGKVIKIDVYKFLNKSYMYNVIFADPPYQNPDYNLLVETCLIHLNTGGRFILESTPREFAISPGRVKAYGDTQISIWET